MTATSNAATQTMDAAWQGFAGMLWQKQIDVRAFIQLNYTPYEGDWAFLAPATARTKKIWERLTKLFVEERKKGVLDISQIPTSITAHAPGYIDRPKRGDRRAADRRSPEARDHAGRRVAHGDQRVASVRVRDRSRSAWRSSQSTARPTTTRSSTRTRPQIRRAALPHHDRLARRLRPRPDHRRLPAGGSVRRRRLIAEKKREKATLDASRPPKT